MNPLKVILSLSVIATTSVALANKQIKVAVIDTGISDSLKDASYLCKDGHKDFTGTGLNDTHGHGTHISGLIDQYAKGIMLSDTNSIKNLFIKKANYCQIIIKFWDRSFNGNVLNTELQALRRAIDLKVDIINFSAGGTEYSEEEDKLITEALGKGIKVVVAAGNERADLNTCERDVMLRPGAIKAYIEYKGTCYFPAVLDSRLIIVGNMKDKKERAVTSNKGDIINSWEIGTDQLSLYSDNSLSKMSGTSQACAKKTGKIIYKMLAK